MATYVQLNPIGPPQLPAFDPDFGFLQKAAQVRNNLYERGFSQLKGLHNSLLSSVPTNDELKERQKFYLQDVENKLKNLPEVDLSIESNVNSARSVFNPFMEDDELIYDVSATKFANSELQKGQSLMMSKDPKQRAMHSPISDEYVQITLDELKRAKSGDGSIYQAKRRSYVPAVDLMDKFSKFLETKNLSVVGESPSGNGYILKNSNGQLIEQPLYTLMNGLMTGDDRKYFDAWGDVVFNRGIKGYMKQGLSEEDARNSLANDIFTQKYNKFSAEIPKLNSAIQDLTTKQAEYEKIYFPDGQIRMDGSDVSQKWQQMVKTKQAYESQKKEFETEKLKLDDPNNQQKEISQYKMLGSSFYGNQILDNSLRSIARGLAGITASKEVKEDKAYWNQIEHNDKVMDNNTKLQIAQMRIDAQDNDGGSPVIDPTTGEILSPNPSPKTKVAKMTEAEKKVAQLNAPDYRGLDTLPRSRPIFKQLAEDKAIADNLSVYSGTNFISSALSTDISGFGGVLLKELRDKHDNGNLWGEQATEYTNGTSKANNANFQAAITAFKNKYGSEYQEFLTKSSIKTPTYGSIYNFLISKSQEVMDKGLLSATKLEEASSARENMQHNSKIVENINNDYKKIGGTILQKILNPQAYSVLVTVDKEGYKRLKTKEEVAKDYSDASKIVGNRPGMSGRFDPYNVTPGGGVIQTMTTPIYADPAKAKALEPYLGDNYDKQLNLINTALVKQAPKLYTLEDDKELSQPHLISYTEDPSVQGEVAEKAINTIFTLQNIADLAGKEDKDPKRSSIDYTALGGKKEDVYSVVKELYNFSTSAGRGLTTITYKQFDPTYDDKSGSNVKAYNIRFDQKAVISDLRSTFKENPTKLAIIDKIASDGLTIRTPIMAPGFLTEYGPVERSFQSKMSYESPEWLKPYTSYTINKYESGYVINGNYTYKDEMGNPKTVDFGEMKVPYNGSFQSINQMMKSFIFGQIKLAEDKYTKAQKTLQQQAPSSFFSKADAEKRVRNQ
jgi:hypothetical protein